MESRRLSDGSMLHVGARGRLRLATFERGVCVATCEGVQEAAFAPFVTAVGDELLARHGRCVFLVDSLDSPRMDTAFREQMTAWFGRHGREGRATAHLLLGSKFIEMAIHVANLATGWRFAFAYTSVAEWEAVGAKELGPTFRRRPLSSYVDAAPKGGSSA